MLKNTAINNYKTGQVVTILKFDKKTRAVIIEFCKEYITCSIRGRKENVLYKDLI